MKKPSRFLRLLGTASLLATLLAGVFATSITYAQPNPDPSDDGAVGDIWDGTEPVLLLNEGGLYFPWVGNDDESTGLGPADTSVSIMNISDEPAVAFAWVGAHDTAELPDTGGWDIVGPFFLAPWASKTFTAAQLGIAEGAGAPVAFAGFNALYSEGGTCTTVLGGPLEPGNDVNDNGECTDVEVWTGGDLPYEGNEDLCVVDDANGDRTNNYEGVEGGGGGLNNDNDCIDAEQGPTGGSTVIDPTVLGGYAKQAVDGETLPLTTAADSSVSGYNALGGFELGEFDDWYFPIAQTNCGPGGCWNTILRIANFGNIVDGEVGQIGSAAVTASFFAADDAQGSLDTGFQLQALLNSGDVWEIDISDYVPEGWVGSVHVYSDSNVFAMADRVKVGYGAWITNTASNAPHTVDNNVAGSLGQYVLFAPDVRFDFFGWNTGINIANLVNQDNNVNVQYFNAFGNAPQTLTRRLAPQGMTYFYDPAIGPQDGSVQDPSADVNADIIGSALIWSDYPVAVAVDATKYPETTTSDDPNIFQAMSYSATANVYTTQAFPLVQKGNPTTGQGATSGINIMNPNANAAQATVWWVNPSGFGADNFGQSAVAIPGFANGFVYTMTQGNLPNGFYGSAVLASTLPVSAVTTQVDYQVEWDGTAVWLGYNPCGYYRDNGFDETELAGITTDLDCNLGDPFNPAGGQVTKIVEDENGDPISGVLFRLVNEAYYQQVILGNEAFAGIPWSGVGYSSVNGVVEWTNVPVGTYHLLVEGVPTTDDNDLDDEELPMYLVDEGYEEVEVDEDVFVWVSPEFTLEEGEDIVLENVFTRILATKEVRLGDDAADVPVCLVEAEDGDDDLEDGEDHEIVDCEVTGADGVVIFTGIEPGWYFVTVNYDFGDDEDDALDPIAGFSPAVFGPEEFGLGGYYINELDVAPAFGNIQKVLTLPGFLVDAIEDGSASLTGVIGIFGPNGFEVEGNVQTEFLDGIGPNDELSYSLTDANVPVGGPYTIDEDITITYDDDDDPTTPPVVFNFTATFDATDEDGQVICDGDLDASSDCEAVEDEDDDDLVPIMVYEDQTTRVFNDFTDDFGHIDVFVRDEVTDLPLEFALVCVFDESAEDPGDDPLWPLIDCDITDADGQAEFPGLGAGWYSFTATHPDYETQGSGIVGYLPSLDAALGSGLNDVLGDEDPFFGFQLDYELALDPAGTFLDVQTLVDGAGVNGVLVQLFLSDPLGGDVGGTGGTCASGTLVGAIETSAQAVAGEVDPVDGIAQFGVDPAQSYCVIADPNGDGTPIAFIDIEADVNPVDFVEGDPANDIDVILEEGGLGVLDVQYTLDGVPTNAVVVYLYLAAAGDTSGSAGVCNGTPVGPAAGVATTTQPVSGQGDVVGIAEFPGMDTTQTYCASLSPFAGAPGPSEADIVIDPDDQADDIDGVIEEVTVPVP